ncbi:MAG TPA: STAS domain-containing protein [Chlamydiales bacterium]|nr:STAS domain-containing protein [Chlamydiales bacterium]
MVSHLSIELETLENKVILRLEGRLDVSSSSILEKKLNTLMQEKHFFLLLDFSQIDYLSSAGLRVLLSMSKQLKAKKGALVLFSLSDEVMDVVKVAGFDRILQIYTSEQQALSAI